jgi:hypothetical protein
VWSDVDAQRVAVPGICSSGGYVMSAATDPRMKADLTRPRLQHISRSALLR